MANDLILKGGKIALIDFFVSKETFVSIVKFDSIKKINGSNIYKNICIDECFEIDIRLGGILSFDSGEDELEAVKILTFPYNQGRILPINSGNNEGVISGNEFLGLNKILSELKIKTKKNKAINSRELKFEISEFDVIPFSEFISYRAFSFTEKEKKFVGVEFTGVYRYGSAGVDEAKFIDRILDLICAQEEPDAMIVDLTKLDYEFGNDIDIATYKFTTMNAPIITISNASNLERLRGAGISCHAIEMPQAINMALARL